MCFKVILYIKSLKKITFTSLIAVYFAIKTLQIRNDAKRFVQGNMFF